MLFLRFSKRETQSNKWSPYPMLFATVIARKAAVFRYIEDVFVLQKQKTLYTIIINVHQQPAWGIPNVDTPLYKLKMDVAQRLSRNSTISARRAMPISSRCALAILSSASIAAAPAMRYTLYIDISVASHK